VATTDQLELFGKAWPTPPNSSRRRKRTPLGTTRLSVDVRMSMDIAAVLVCRPLSSTEKAA
jgi:hypothetical protein